MESLQGPPFPGRAAAHYSKCKIEVILCQGDGGVKAESTGRSVEGLTGVPTNAMRYGGECVSVGVS